ncbi:MAG TPA: hypothetical protein VLA68_03095 [Nitrososphaera sp.]|nr:hypothetical protein [Nitrososphaera sp.]
MRSIMFAGFYEHVPKMTKIINEKKTNSLVKYFTTAFSVTIAALLISGFVSQAFAADMTTFLVPDRDKTDGSFIGVRTITLKYPAGSAMADEFDGKNERVTFSFNGTATEQDSSAAAVIAALNNALADAQSPVHASAVEVTYTGVIRGSPTSTVISYKVELQPTLEEFVLQRGEGGQSGHIVDLEWRGIAIEGPLVVSTAEYGEFDINHPIALLQETHPSVAQALANSQAREIMEDPILDFEDFDFPMSSWHKLFDPVGAYGGGVGLQGTEGAKALTVYSLGESSLREGAHTVEEKDATATISGVETNVHSQNPPPSGQITIAGYANEQENEGAEFAIVTADAPEGVATSTGGFPIQVLLVLGGMMGAIAIFILFKARK